MFDDFKAIFFFDQNRRNRQILIKNKNWPQNRQSNGDFMKTCKTDTFYVFLC